MRSLVITLCGSNRFEDYFKAWNKALSLAGHVVFTTSTYPSFEGGVKEWHTPAEKDTLDEVHLRKIDLSQAIFVINVNAYIGDSTRREIAHARCKGKVMYALESWGEGNGVSKAMHNKAATDRSKQFGIPDGYGSPINTAYPYFRDCWGTELLGPGGEARDRLLKILRRVAPL